MYSFLLLRYYHYKTITVNNYLYSVHVEMTTKSVLLLCLGMSWREIVCTIQNVLQFYNFIKKLEHYLRKSRTRNFIYSEQLMTDVIYILYIINTKTNNL